MVTSGRSLAEALRDGEIVLPGNVVRLSAGDRIWQCQAEANFLQAAREHGQVLADGGSVLVADERVNDAFTTQADEVERLSYAFSVLHCLPATMAESTAVANSWGGWSAPARSTSTGLAIDGRPQGISWRA